jgi:alpha-glucosidase
MMDLGAAGLDREAHMGTWGTGPFSSDGALDLLDELAGQPTRQRREALERLFFRIRDRPDLLGSKFFPDEIVAAAAFLAAGLPGGEGLRQDLADQGYDVDAILVPAPDPELNHSALEALLVAAGRDGPWHDGWVDTEIAAQARQTTDRLAAILLREEHSQDQELPLQY